MVYVVFNRVTRESANKILRTGDVVLVRDDNGGASTRPFTALVDPDKRPGRRVVKQRTFGWDQCLGGDRLSGDLAIAVHPKNAGTVYLVWSQQVGIPPNDHPALHVMKSRNAGVQWSPVLRTITNAKNPGLAINSKGTVGFLYQQVVREIYG